MVLAYTEFAHRVWSNASTRTDHGSANVVFAVVQPGRGGFRSVYATAFESILGVDPKSFLGGTFPVQASLLA